MSLDNTFINDTIVDVKSRGNDGLTKRTYSQQALNPQIYPKSDPNLKQAPKSVKVEMQEMLSHLTKYKHKQIYVPSDKSNLLLQINSSIFYFGCKGDRLFFGSLNYKDKKIPILFPRAGLRAAGYLGNGQVALATKLNLIFIFSLEIQYDIKLTEILDFSFTKQQEIKTENKEIAGFKAFSSEKTFFTLENNEDEAMVYQWNNFNPLKLYSANSKGYCMDANIKYNYIASGHDDCLFIYETEYKIFKKHENEKAGKIVRILISNDCKYAVYGGANSNVFVLRLREMELQSEIFPDSGKINCLMLLENDRFLITCGSQGKIHIWDLEQYIDGYALADFSCENKKVSVKSMLMDENYVLHSFLNTGQLTSFKVVIIDQYFRLKIEEKVENVEFLFTLKSQEAEDEEEEENICIVKDFSLYSMNLNTLSLKKEQKFVIPIINKVGIDAESETICAASQEDSSNLCENSFKGVIFSISQSAILSTLKFEIPFLIGLHYSFTHNYLIAYGKYQYKIIKISDNKILSPVIHKDNINSVVADFSQKLIFSSDDTGTVLINRIVNDVPILERLLVQHETKALKLWIIPGNVYLLANYSTSNMNIWEINKGVKMNTCHSHGLIDVIFPSNSNLGYFLTSKSLLALDIPSFIPYFEINFKEVPKNVCFIQNQKNILVNFEHDFIVYNNPLLCQKIKPFGDFSKISDYYKIGNQLLEGNIKQHDCSMNKWYLAPYGTNVMHFYAFIAKEKLLEQGFNSGAGFFPSKQKYTPLDICLARVNEDCIDLIFNKLKKFPPLKLWVLENSLLKLNLCPYFSVSKFYDLFLLKSLDNTLPKHLDNEVELPIIGLSENIIGDCKFIIPEAHIVSEGKELFYKQTYMAISLIPGSRDSILLAKSIQDTENTEIFNSEFIKVLLDLKWSKIKHVLYSRNMFFLFYLATLSVYGIERTNFYFQISFSFNLMLTAYEIIQIISGHKTYFRNKYNYIDLSRAALNFIFFARFNLGYTLFREELVILLLLSWFKFTSFFRLFPSTRYFVNMLSAVLLDSLPFIIFLLFSTVSLSIIYTVLLDSGEGYFFYLKAAWELSNGSFTTTDFGYFKYFIFFIYTLLIPIILMNLLISIISDTFSKVNQNLSSADGKELITLIIEGENILFWNRDQNFKQHIHYCFREYRQEKTTSELSALKEKIKEVAAQNNAIEAELGKLNNKMEEMSEKFDRVLDFIKK